MNSEIPGTNQRENFAPGISNDCRNLELSSSKRNNSQYWRLACGDAFKIHSSGINLNYWKHSTETGPTSVERQLLSLGPSPHNAGSVRARSYFPATMANFGVRMQPGNISDELEDWVSHKVSDNLGNLKS